MRSRQSIRINQDPEELSPRQENALIKSSKDKIKELIGVPVTSFESSPSPDQVNFLIKNVSNQGNTLIKGINNQAAELMDIPEGTLMDIQTSTLENNSLSVKATGIFGIGLLAPRPNIPHEYITTTVSPRNIPIISKISTSNYFFIIYDNPNVIRTTVGSILKSFAVIKTLNQCTVKDCSEMLKLHYTNITAISENDYLTGSFEHPKYSSDSGYPLSVRYAEIPIIKQKTPGRLDNIPLGYPDFDSTPDGVTTRKGPVPTPPYTNFTWENKPADYISAPGATSSGSIINVITTRGLTSGMYILITTQGIGTLASNTKVISILNNKQFTVSPPPLVALSGTKNVITGTLPASISVGGSVKFMDDSVRNPWQFAPTGWNWVFGPSASPTGSTGRNPLVTYGTAGNYEVTLTASNASGSTTKTKKNFVIVTT